MGLASSGPFLFHVVKANAGRENSTAEGAENAEFLYIQFQFLLSDLSDLRGQSPSYKFSLWMMWRPERVRLGSTASNMPASRATGPRWMIRA